MSSPSRNAVVRLTLGLSLLLVAACRSILGIEPSPGAADAGVAPDAWAGVEVMRDEFEMYDEARWEGHLWCGNESAGAFAAEAGERGLQMRGSSTCIGQVRSRQSWELPVRLTLALSPQIRAGRIPTEAASFGVADDWLYYSGGRGAGGGVREDTLVPWSADAFDLAPLGSVEAGAEIEIVVDVNSDGDVWVKSSAGERKMAAVLGAAQRLSVLLAVENSDRGFDVHRVVVERPLR